MSEQLPEQVVEEISEAIFKGRKIHAIKVYREQMGVDLKTAKEFVDALAERLREEAPERFQGGGAGCSGQAAALLILIGAVVYTTWKAVAALVA